MNNAKENEALMADALRNLDYYPPEDILTLADTRTVEGYLYRQQLQGQSNVESLGRKRLFKVVRKEVEKLPPLEGQIVNLIYWEGLTEREVATKLDLELPKMRKTLLSALVYLGDRILLEMSRQYRFKFKDILCLLDG